MKSILLICLLTGFSLSGITQSITKAHFNISGRFGQINSASLFINNWLIQINRDGEVINYDYLPGGEITYYSPADGFDREGKIKSIGGIPIDYYTRFDLDEKMGKIKSIGNMQFDYYDRFGDDDMLGKLKSIGSSKFDYYNKFGDDDLLKKLKTVGNISINYYDKFGDNALIGRVKSIGPVQVKYFGSFSATNNHGIQSIEGNTRDLYVTAGR